MRRRNIAVLAVLASTFVVALTAATSSAVPPPGTFNLYAGQTTLVGAGTITNDATNLYIDWTLDSNWCMTASHVEAAWDVSNFVLKNGNPPPGQFRYKASYSPCAQAPPSPVVIPIADVLGTSDGTPVVAVHLDVWDKTSLTTTNVVSDAATNVTSFNGVAQAPAASVAANEPVGYPICGSYLPSPTPGSVWDTQNGGSASNDAGGPFDGATWIWRTLNPQFPDAGEYATFVRTFTVPGLPVSGSILVTADNGYQLSFNGSFLGQAQIYTPAFPGSLKEDGVNTTGWQTPETWTLPLQGGLNTLSIVAANEFAYPDDVPNQQTTGVGGVPGGVCPNPGALIFKAQYSSYTRSESAWADTAPKTHNFAGSNWATYVPYELQDVLLETVTVPAALPSGPGGVDSSTVLASGKQYLFKVTGTVTWTNRNGSDLVDAECTSESGGTWAAAAAGYPDDLLELQVNSTDVDWSPVGSPNGAGCDTAGHEYTLGFTGLGSSVNLRIYDGTGGQQDLGWFGDNAGSLTVEIWRVLP